MATLSFGQSVLTAEMRENADTQGPPEDDDEPELVASMMQTDTAMETEEPGPCKHIRMPPNLCTSCQMKQHNDMGVFPGNNQRDIYEIDDACKTELNAYADMNKCDTRYGNAIRTLDSLTSSYRRVAYFLYAVCEACCDCIPIGASADQYDDRKAAGTLINIRRGNCPAHFWWDTCKLWPEVRRITGKNGNPRDDLPNVCDILEQWLDSPNGDRWPRNPNVDGLGRDEKRLLKQIVLRTKCTNKDVWQTCANLEEAQDRI